MKIFGKKPPQGREAENEEGEMGEGSISQQYRQKYMVSDEVLVEKYDFRSLCSTV